MKRTLLVAAVGLFIAGCSTINTDSQRIQVACAGITSAVQVLTLHKDKMTDGQIETTVRALDLATPVCGQGPEPTTDTIKLAAIEAVQMELAKLATEVRTNE